MVFDVSSFTKSHVVNEKDAFYTFAESLIKRLLYLCKNYERYDVIADRYLQNSFKENIRNTLGLGSRKVFDNDTRIRSDFKCDFLTNIHNKNDLHI